MPFGYEPKDAERQINENDGYERHYVAVTASIKKNGSIIPISFLWDNGMEYKIDEVLDVRQGRSLKYTNSGLRYQCLYGDKKFYLFYTGDKWYVEMKQPGAN